MPKRIKYTELLAERDRLSLDNGLLMQALADVVRDRPDAVERVSMDGYRWTLRLYRARGCAGGIVVQSYAAPNQRAWITAHYLDQLRADYSDGARCVTDEALAIACAVERLTIKRNQLCDKATAEVSAASA